MKISIIIPVYNQARYIGQAIESALQQTYPAHQIVVVNDGSTDATEEVCARYSDRIEYIKQANAGPSAARNTGIRHLSGDAVVFLDGDDLLDPDWVAQAVDAYQQAQAQGVKVGAIYSDYVVFDEDGRYQKKIRIKSISLPGLLRDPLLIPSGSFVPKVCLEDVGYFKHDLITCEDWDYWLRAALHGYRFIRVKTWGFKHREHSGSLSKREVPALQGRVTFLQMWLDSDQLNDAQKAALRQELARTFFRLRRAAYFQGQQTHPYLRQALELNPSAVMDPWLFVYGAVYASPFFRAQIDSRQVRQSVDDLHRDVTKYLDMVGRLDERTRRRLRASSALARAASDVVAHHYVRAGTALLSAVAADPGLLHDTVRRSSDHGAELIRARGIL